ncbi:MAG: UvrD-helicase domain-containing protein [Trueperaceae bacterium]|nr:UvrD-helicase domain-containing protein [Trueperaceae bacterium]
MYQSPIALTDEQQRVVAHDTGPALVFAVAGAGKTTTLVRRVERLIREEKFRAERILATSFSKATVDDLKKALSLFPHARKVPVKTLHSLAYQIIREAKKVNKDINQELPQDIDSAPYAILNRALTLARSKNAPFSLDLDTLDREDFLTYVGGCKATLAFTRDRYKTISKTSVASLAKQPASLRWYLDLFELYEQARLEMNLLTFDDLIPEAWIHLIDYPELADHFREQFDTILVDEFQDTNLSQVELLDVLVAKHKNLMVCGDDDQGIFGFRKASNTFILNFTKRYGGARYQISDNFRCFAEHTILANHVIQRNRDRVQKLLTPARGFGGKTLIESHESAEAMGTQIASNIAQAIDSGLAPNEIAVLVRLYAETGVIEAALIEQGIPYQIIGNVPFYERSENTLLIKYLQVALIDSHMNQGFSASDKALLSEIWWDVLRTPKRYVKREVSDSLLREILIHETAPSVVLLTAGNQGGYAGPKLVALGQIIAWLSESIAKGLPAYALLLELEQRLDYKTFLKDNSGFAETGQTKAETVNAFIEYTKTKGDVASLLNQIEQARSIHQGQRQAKITISSIFRAKGLEWPHVIVPAINFGHIPAAGNDIDLSEERRLFYVALTRTKATLELHVIKNRPPSIFMEGLSQLRDISEKSQAAFNHSSHEWTSKDALAVVDVYPYLQRYLSIWSNFNEAEKHEIAEWILAANEAWKLKTTAPLTKALESSLKKHVQLDPNKLEACAHTLSVKHKMVQEKPKERRPYDVSKDGALNQGTVVWHKLHGQGKVLNFSAEGSMKMIEVTFDKGRTVKLLAEHSGLDVIE